MEIKLKLFNQKAVRTVWNADEEEWYFSVVDVCNVLSDSAGKDPGAYWRKLKQRLKAEGSEVVTKCHELKMQAADGKYYKTDALNTKGVLRLIQSIPSPKAEPFKIWLAQVGSERLDEIADPEKAIQRGAAYYREKGYSDEWINQRLRTIEIRKKLTDEWSARGVETDLEYAILTNDMTKAWSGLSIKDYKALKGLKKESLKSFFVRLSAAFFLFVLIQAHGRGIRYLSAFWAASPWRPSSRDKLQPRESRPRLSVFFLPYLGSPPAGLPRFYNSAFLPAVVLPVPAPPLFFLK